MVPRTERQVQSRGPRPRGRVRTTAASAHTGRAATPFPSARAGTDLRPLPGRPEPLRLLQHCAGDVSSSSGGGGGSSAPGGRCCSPSRPRRCCRGRRARGGGNTAAPAAHGDWVMPRHMTTTPGRGERGGHHRENRSFHSFHGSPIDIPAEGRGFLTVARH